MKAFTLKWDDLTDKEKEMAREQYIHIREWEEREIKQIKIIHIRLV